MKNISLVSHPFLLAVLLCAAGLFYSPVANAHHCPLCEMAEAGDAEGIRTFCQNHDGEPSIVDDRDSLRGRTALLVAARHHRIGTVTQLLHGEEPNCSPAHPGIANNAGRTPLMWAAHYGGDVGEAIASLLYSAAEDLPHTEYVDFLNMRKNAPGNQTAADYAFRGDNYGILMPLLSQGGKFGPIAGGDNRVSLSGTEMFEHVVSEMSVKIDEGVYEEGAYWGIAEAMLEANSLNPAFRGQGSLFNWSVLNQKGELAARLIKQFAPEVSQEDIDDLKLFVDEGETFASADAALRHAAENNNAGVVRVLIAMGVDESLVDGQDRTPLMLAAGAGSGSAVSVLVGHDMEAGYSLLYSAAGEGDVDVVSVLLEHGGLDAERANGAGKTAVHIATEADHGPVVSVLVGDNEDAGYAALYRAAEEGAAGVVSVLINSLDVNRADSDGKAALHFASDAGREGVVSVLVADDSLDVNQKDLAMNAALHLAALKGHEAVVSALVADDSLDVNIKDSNGDTALHLAALRDQAPVASILLDEDATDVTLTNGMGKTALQIAIEEENDDVISSFVSRVSNIVYGALYEAAENGRVTVVSALSEQDGLDVDRQREADGNAALHLAALHDQAPVVSVLLAESTANATLTSRAGKTALEIAMEEENDDVVSALISHDPNIGYDALYSAARDGRVTAVSVLLGPGSLDVNRRGSNGAALHIAARHGRVTVVSVLLGNSTIEVKEKDREGDDGKTALYLAAEGERSGVVSALLNYDLNIGYSDLHKAAEDGQVTVVSVLLGPGSLDVNRKRESDGNAALHLVALHGHAPVVSVLLAENATDATLTSRAGKTALQIAIEEENDDVVSALISHDPNIGYDALYSAARDGRVTAVSVLLGHDSLDVNRADSDGKAALHFASDAGREAVVSVLVGNVSLAVNQKDLAMNAALHLAALKGHDAVVFVLVGDDRLDVNLTNRAGKTATDIAFARNREVAVSLIVWGNGVFNDHDVFSGSHVINYLGSGHMDRSVAANVARAILEAGNINPPLGGKPSLLYWAFGDRGTTVGRIKSRAFWDSFVDDVAPETASAEDVADLKAELKWRVNDSRYTVKRVLNGFVANGKADAVRILFRMGADPDPPEANPPSIYLATVNNRAAVISVFAEFDVDFDRARNGSFRMIDIAAWHGLLEAAKSLVAGGASLGPNDSELRRYKTPLFAAATTGQAHVITYLADLINVNAENDRGQVPLDFAVERDHVSAVEALIAKGANAQRRTSPHNRTLLMNAARSGDVNVMPILVSNGVNVNDTDSSGWSALHHAIFSTHLPISSFRPPEISATQAEVIEKLLDLDASMRRPVHTTHGYPLQRAVRHGSTDVMNAFLNHRRMSDNLGTLEQVIYSTTYEILVEEEIDRRFENLRTIINNMRRLGMNCSSNFEVTLEDDTRSEFAAWAQSAMAEHPLHADRVEEILENCPNWPHSLSVGGSSGVSAGVAGASGGAAGAAGAAMGGDADAPDAYDGAVELWDLEGGDAPDPIIEELFDDSDVQDFLNFPSFEETLQ